ncbi:MAG: thymidylate kinase, partial [Mesorhizobium sp.]
VENVVTAAVFAALETMTPAHRKQASPG